MHSSRMRTVPCSGRLSCHAHTPPVVHAPPAMHTPLHACPALPRIPPTESQKGVKHYLSATTVADGNKQCYIYRYRLITRATFQRIQAQQAAEAQNQTVPSNEAHPAYNQAYPPVNNTYPPPVSNTTYPSTYPAPEPFGMSNKGYEDPPLSYESLKH